MVLTHGNLVPESEIDVPVQVHTKADDDMHKIFRQSY